MQLVRISLAFSACCLAWSDSPVDKEKEVSVSLSSQRTGNLTRSPSPTVKWRDIGAAGNIVMMVATKVF